MKKCKTYNGIQKAKHLQCLVLLAICIVLSMPSPSLAACADPVGAEGQMTYNTTHKVVQFCDGTNWYTTKDGGGTNPFDNTNCTDGAETTYNASTQQFECIQASDGNYNSVVLLAHFDSDFSDSSASNHTLTANGNTTISTTQKKFGAGSAYFDGSGDYLSIVNNGDFTFGTGDFTIEGWFYITAASSYATLFTTAPTTNSQGVWLGTNPSGNWDANMATGGSWETIGNSDPVTLNTWVHLAYVRSGSNIYLFENGTLIDSRTSSLNLNANTTVTIGGRTLSSQYTTGYIDELRITKGVARYTSNFTVPAEVFPDAVVSQTDANYNNVVLLLNAEQMADSATNFTDKSIQNHAMTANGNAKSSFSSKKFGNASMAFDGTNDMISTPDSADWDFGAGDFTVEGWVKFGALPANGAYAALVNQASWNTGQRSWFVGMQGQASGQRFTFFYTTDGSNWTYFYGDTVSYSTGAWYHFAVVRDGSNVRIFVNGQQTGSAGNISTNTIFNGTNNLEVGGRDATETAQDFNGNLDDVRITKGVARYTADFTPPDYELPYEADVVTSDSSYNNVVLLTHFDTDLSDSSPSSHTLTALGDAAVSSAQKKFGAGSLGLDGTGDYVTVPDSDDWWFGTGDFTIEANVRFNALPASGAFYGIVSQIPGGTDGWSAYIYNNGGTMELRFFRRVSGAGDAFVRTIGITTNTWYHFAWTRQGNTFRMFQDGNQLGTSDNMTVGLSNITHTLEIGAHNTASDQLNGNIDELRITKGVARYTSSFVPPTAAFPDSSPDAFTFTDQTGVTTSTAIESNIIQISGMDDGTAISISGDGSPQYRICADATCSSTPSYTSSSGTINAGDYVQLKLTSNAFEGTTNSATLTIGPISDQWDVTTSGTPGDNYYDDTILLLSGNDHTNTGRFTDSSRYNRVVSRIGDTLTSNSVKKYGFGSLYFDGNSDVLTIPYNSDFVFGTGDFTIEWYEYRTSDTGFQATFNIGYNQYTGMQIQRYNGGGGYNLYWSNSSNNPVGILAEPSAPPLNTWVHYAVVRSGNNFTLYRDGTSVSTGTSTVSFGTSNSFPLYIGGAQTAGSHWFPGYLDEIRITKGVARYTSNFTPPAEEFLATGPGTGSNTATQPVFDPTRLANVSVLKNYNKTLYVYDGNGTSLGANYGLYSINSGKYYMEFNYVGDGNSVTVGVVNASQGSSPDFRNLNTSNAFGRLFGSAGPAGTTNISSGDTIGVAIDATAKTLDIYRNNVKDTAMSGTYSVTGNVFFAWETWNAGSVRAKNIADYSYSPPSGYTAGWVSSSQ